MPRYALGLDFGTESARALLVDVAGGRAALFVTVASGLLAGLLVLAGCGAEVNRRDADLTPRAAEHIRAVLG